MLGRTTLPPLQPSGVVPCGAPLASPSGRFVGFVAPKSYGPTRSRPLRDTGRSLVTPSLAPQNGSGAAAPTYDSSSEFEGTPTSVNWTLDPLTMDEKGKKLRDYTEVAYLTGRSRVVADHFATSLGIDDFLHRLEIALYAYGFNGDNSIGECSMQ